MTVTSSAYRDRFLPIYSGTNQISGLDPGWSFDAALESVHRDEAVTPGPVPDHRVGVAADGGRAARSTP